MPINPDFMSGFVFGARKKNADMTVGIFLCAEG